MSQATPRELSDGEKSAILGRVTGGWSRILRDTVDVFDRPAFIAGEEERSPLAVAVRDLSRLNCRLWARADKTNYSPSVNDQNAEICGPYLGSISELPGGASLAPPFTGGQCVGSRYSVNYTRTVTGPIGTQNLGIGNQPGPIISVVGAKEGTIFRTRITRGSTSNGTFGTIIANEVSIGSQTASISNITVIRTSGSNDCGDPPPLYTAPPAIVGGTPPTGDITINLPGVGDIGLTVELDPDGRPVVCIPALDVCATVDLPFFVEDGGGGGEGVAPGDLGEPGSPSDVDGGEDVEGDAPSDSVLTAIKINILDAPESAREFAPGVFRAVCYAYLGTADGLDLDPAGAVLRDGQLILAEKDNLTKFRVAANIGFRLRVTPFFREVQ